MNRHGPRRVQYSSCDQCRRARVACDANRIQKAYRSAGVPGSAPCTRCETRRKQCTFDWMKHSKGCDARSSKSDSINVQQPPAATSQAGSPDGRALLSTDTGNGYSHSTLPSPPLDTANHQEAIGPFEAQWLHALYSQSFEIVFGSWMGRSCNPFTFQGPRSDASSAQGKLASDNTDLIISISSICAQLDRWAVEHSAAPTSQLYSGRILKAVDDETLTQRSLDLAIQAFAARWLPLVTDTTSTGISSHELAKKLWREARVDMMNVVNRPCYRSALSLILFGLTPIPTDITEEEENAGLPGDLSIQAALQQVYMLRARQRNLQFNGSKVSTSTTQRLVPNLDPITAANFINAESVAYWAALTFDTSASLTFGSRPLLSPGLLGFEADYPWSLVRSCTEIFRDMTTDWHDAGFTMTDTKAQQVIAAGAAWKLLAWKLSAVFREALRDGHDENEVRKVYSAILETVQQYNSTYRDLMEACRRRIHFLNLQTKLCYYELTMHYNLSILLAVDAIETTGQLDLLPGIRSAQVDAESSILNALTFGLETPYSLFLPRLEEQSDESNLNNQNGLPRKITKSLVSVDPYPHHVVAAVKLLRRAIDRDIADEAITAEAFHSVLSILQKTLELLPSGSQSVQAARLGIVSGYP